MGNMTDRVKAVNAQQQSLVPNQPVTPLQELYCKQTMQKTYQKKMAKMSILPWQHKWLLLRVLSTKTHFLIFTEYVQCACTAGAKSSGETEPACSMALSLCPSTSAGEGNMTQSWRFFPYSLLAGEAEFPRAWVVAGDEEHLPGSHSSARFCADWVIWNTFLVWIQEASVMAPQKTR